MNGLAFLDLLLTAAAVAASWKLFDAAQPPSGEAGSRAPGLVAAPAQGMAERRVRPPAQEVLAPLQETLRRICADCGYAGIEVFVEGAKRAYEMIVDGFATGRIEPVAFLLSRDVHTDFARAVGERADRGETVEQKVIGFRAAEVIDAGILDGTAWIEVRFVCDMVSVTRDRDGRNVAGHPTMVAQVAELWTFERDLRSAEPHWLLAATEPDE